jgi:predicted Zn-dependent protease
MNRTISQTSTIPGLLDSDEIARRIEAVIEASPADETEVLWLEAAHHQTTGRGRRFSTNHRLEKTVSIRVLDRGRVGSHRTGSTESGDLSVALRAAIAQSRVRDPLPGLPHLPTDTSDLIIPAEIYDDSIAGLSEQESVSILKRLIRKRESMTLEWADHRVAVFNSRKVQRQVAVTGAGLTVDCGRQPGAGRSEGAARNLQALNMAAVADRARDSHASGPTSELGTSPVVLVLSPEATAVVCDLLNRVAFSAIAYYEGSSFLREHLGVQVFDRGFSIRDDGTSEKGLAFPFDLEGTAKRPVELIDNGTPKTPALDQRQAALLGLPPTAHAIAGNDARAENIFVLPGTQSQQDLLEVAEDGVWIGSIGRVECFEPSRVQIRAAAHGVRRIRSGRLDRALPDLFWQDSLLRAFSNLAGIGSETVLSRSREGFLGAISAPSLAISGVTGLRVV